MIRAFDWPYHMTEPRPKPKLKLKFKGQSVMDSEAQLKTEIDRIEAQIGLLRKATLEAEINALQARLDRIHEVITDNCEYSDDLVWYARKSPHTLQAYPRAAEQCSRIEMMYPEEVCKIKDPISGDFQHGWNSAHLAFYRLVTGLIEADDTVEDMNGYASDEEEQMTVEDMIRDICDEYPQLDT